MALHTELPIHRTGVRLLALAFKVQEQMPRSVKRILGEKVTQHCVDMLDLMALANASQRAVRAGYIEELLRRQRAITVLLRVSHDSRYLSPKLWAESVELLGSRRELSLVPAHKSLFHAPDGHGLPIGNLSSQFFANVLLDDLDQFVKHRLRAPHYVRYVDDFILLHDSAQWLNEARAAIERKLASLHLALNPRKTILQPVARGIDFVGHLVKPWRRITRRCTVRLAMDRLQDLPAAELHQSGNSYFGLLGQASHSHHDRTRLARLMLARGHVIAGDMRKAFRRPEQ